MYVGLGGYMSGLRGPGTFGDPNPDPDVTAGNLFKSTDACASFKSVHGDLPNVPVSSVLVRGGQLIIGTDFGMFISADDAGTKWAPMGNGLPAVPVTMLRLKPDDPNRLFISTFGRGIWTYDFPPEARIALPAAPVAAIKDTNRFGGSLSLVSLAGLLRGLRRRRL